MNDLGNFYILGTVFDFILILIGIVLYIVYKNTISSVNDKLKISVLVIVIVILSWISFSVMVILICIFLLKKILKRKRK